MTKSKAKMKKYLLIPTIVSLFMGLFASLSCRHNTVAPIETGDQQGIMYQRIPIKAENIYPQTISYSKENGVIQDVSKMIDEEDIALFDKDGYPVLTNKKFKTAFMVNKYARDASPYHIYIDLTTKYEVGRLYFYGKTKFNFKVYGIEDIGSDMEYIGEIKSGYGEWGVLTTEGVEARFLVLVFDDYLFGEEERLISKGSEFIPFSEICPVLEPIYAFYAYGLKKTDVPDNILPPARREREKRTVGEFFNTNGHIYQDGRIHKMCSGSNVRLFQPFSQYAAFTGIEQMPLEPYKQLSEMKFRLNLNDWIKDNNSSGRHTIDHLRESYKAIGLSPWIANSGTFNYCSLRNSLGNKKVKENREIDDYWIEGRWKPLPVKEKGGYKKYWEVTKDPLHYGTMAKLAYNLGAVYGGEKVDKEMIQWYTPRRYNHNPSTGHDLLWGVEFGNEDDANWDGWIGYTDPEEFAARQSAVYDGHLKSIEDETGRRDVFGMNGRLKIITPGMTSPRPSYFLRAYLFWKRTRGLDAPLPLDVISVHVYSNNVWVNQERSGSKNQYAVTFEDYFRSSRGAELRKMIDFRNRYMPDKEFDMGEWGFGESGLKGGVSTNQCFSQPGRVIGNWQIPDMHRSDVKGAWAVRASLTMLKEGFDISHYYSTECEKDYFNEKEHGYGAGLEMFHWNDVPQGEPGSKTDYIKKYEVKYSRPSFSTLGLFGNLLINGGYPITRAYWWIATFRNRLEDYEYIGTKISEKDDKIMIFCFRKKNENKGAYVIYYDDSRNMGIPNVSVSIPEEAKDVVAIEMYIPELPDPSSVPDSLGKIATRAGMPTTRRGESGEIIFPTAEENPYFPLVGPVGLNVGFIGNRTVAANEFVERNGDKWVIRGDNRLAWRQIFSLCDYIEFHPEGVRGSHGDEKSVVVKDGKMSVNVSEFPKIYLFDGVPDIDYQSEITDVSAVVRGDSVVELYWNNHNPEDTGYEVFISDNSGSGYSKIMDVEAGKENRAVINSLKKGRHYLKVRAVCGEWKGEISRGYAVVDVE